MERAITPSSVKASPSMLKAKLRKALALYLVYFIVALPYFLTKPVYVSVGLVRQRSTDMQFPLSNADVQIARSPALAGMVMGSDAWKALGPAATNMSTPQFLSNLEVNVRGGEFLLVSFSATSRQFAQVGAQEAVKAFQQIESSNSSGEWRKRIAVTEKARAEMLLEIAKVTEESEKSTAASKTAALREKLKMDQDRLKSLDVRLEYFRSEASLDPVEILASGDFPGRPAIDHRTRNSTFAVAAIAIPLGLRKLRHYWRRRRRMSAARGAFPVVFAGAPRPVIELEPGCD